jgi:ribosomal protein L40E
MCPQCYAEFPPEVKFCRACGAKTKQIVDNSQKTTCPRCYSEIEPNLTYCSECGSDLTLSLTCRKCKVNIPPGINHCPVCGSSQKVKGVPGHLIHEKLRRQRKRNRKTVPSGYGEVDKKTVHVSELEKINHHGYLVCNRCGGYYELQPDESPGEFNGECSCGGKLQHKLKL